MSAERLHHGVRGRLSTSHQLGRAGDSDDGVASAVSVFFFFAIKSGKVKN